MSRVTPDRAGPAPGPHPDPVVAFAYSDGEEQLSDYAERFGLLAERLRLVRSLMPEAAPVVPERVKRELLEEHGETVGALGARLDELDARIAERTAVAERLGVALPIELARRRLGLSQLDVEIVTMLAALETGRAFNPYDTRSDRLEALQPEVGLFMALLSGGERAAAEEVRRRFLRDAPLVGSGVVLFEPDAGADSPLIQRRIRLAERVLDFVTGGLAPPPSVLGSAAGFAAEPAGAESLLLDDPSLVGRAARALADPAQLLVLRGAPGVGRKALAGAAARELGRPVLSIDLSRVGLDPGGLGRSLRVLLREARVQDAVLVLDRADEFADGEGQSGAWAVLVEALSRSSLPTAAVCEHLPPWIGRLPRVLLELDVPFPSAESQRRLWVRHLPPTLRLDGELSIDSIVGTYSLSCASILGAFDELRRIDRVHGGQGRVDAETLLEVVRRRLSHRLGDLADVVRTTLDWSDVILPEEVLDRVIEFLNFARHRQAVMRDWGFGRKLAYGRGLSALFSGPPGTGKTMICSLLAKELGMELYRIDLAQVVNKYIGETEKNLGRVFDEAARGQVILLFDEADSIFARRTEVKSSHDRYANLEVNYLLQRMEGFEGIVVMTTNSENSIDRAFLRRIRFRVRFPAPSEEERERLWRGMVPKETRLGPDVDFGVLAARFPMAGGNIMNALVRAAVGAAAAGGPVMQEHLLWAAELEYTEMGFLA